MSLKVNSHQFYIKYPKTIKDINMNLNVENYNNSTIKDDTNNINNMNNNFSFNKHILNTSKLDQIIM